MKLLAESQASEENAVRLRDSGKTPLHSVIVVTKSAPELLTPCGCPCICHEPLKCSFRIRVSECNSFLNYYSLFPGLMKILIHVMLRMMDNCFLYIS